MTLTEHDKASSLWIRLKAHFETRLAELRKRNDMPGAEHDTALLRGEIKCIKGLLALGADRPVID
jgi:hypothetical protein